jgi:hypothetical protein
MKMPYVGVTPICLLLPCAPEYHDEFVGREVVG